MSKHNLCPICEAGELHEHIEPIEVEYHGHTATLDSRYSVCDACASEQADAAQTRQNKRATIAFRKTVDGLLTGAQIRTLRESLGLTQAQAARIFGGGPVAFSKYEHDDVTQSDAMDKLLRVANAVPEALAHLERAAHK